MAVLNDGTTCISGIAESGRCVSNADYGSQNIPSAEYDDFVESCQPVREDGKIEKRYPWNIKQPETTDQLLVQNLFLECIEAWGRQPVAGGVEPPAIGPRNRSWWYDASLGSGLFYYTYFMKLTLPYRHAGNFPDWWDWP